MGRGWHRVGFPVGHRKDRLEVIGERITVDRPRGRFYLYPCRCSCGQERLLDAGQLGRYGSCGCARKEAQKRFAQRNRTHGGSGTKLYGVWHGMRNRCRRKDLRNSHRYYGRGIAVCEAWACDFAAFRKWAIENGYRVGLQLDRIDNDGDYTPSNCRWVTSAENNHNRGRDTRITAFGDTKCALEWSRDQRCRVSDSTILYRMRKMGWSAERAISTPSLNLELASAQLAHAQS